MALHCPTQIPLKCVIRHLGALALIFVHYSAFSQEILTLTQVLDEVASKNPDLSAAQAQSQAAEAEVGTEFYLPAPTLNFGTMGEQNPFSTRMEQSWGLTQMIPFPTKIAQKRSSLHFRSEAASENLRAKGLEVHAEASKAYFDYWRSQRIYELLQEKLQVLNEHAKRIRSTPFASQLMQSHLLSVQSDIDLTENEIFAAKQEIEVSRGMLNVLMGRNPGSALGLPEEWKLSPLPPAPSDALIESAAKLHPKNKAAESEIRATEAKLSAARSEYLPDFMVGYRYNQRFDSLPSNHEFMVGITLPFIFPWQPKAQVDSAHFKNAEAQAVQVKSLYDIRLQILRSYSQLTSSYSQVLQIENKTLPQATKRQKISHGIAPTDTESLMEHREAMEKLVELKLRQVDLKVSYEKALRDYQALTISGGTHP